MIGGVSALVAVDVERPLQPGSRRRNISWRTLRYDNRHFHAIGDIVIVEIASGGERDAERRQVTRSNPREPGRPSPAVSCRQSRSAVPSRSRSAERCWCAQRRLRRGSSRFSPLVDGGIPERRSPGNFQRLEAEIRDPGIPSSRNPASITPAGCADCRQTAALPPAGPGRAPPG